MPVLCCSDVLVFLCVWEWAAVVFAHIGVVFNVVRDGFDRVMLSSVDAFFAVVVEGVTALFGEGIVIGLRVVVGRRRAVQMVLVVVVLGRWIGVAVGVSVFGGGGLCD
ncbi:hypothetical protein [Ahrensia kielensis]|uniref:hypothetical protein n=1 Tax=Ahrensia kielensis TaxID=76980 RepID=UPI000373DE0D|nr:hypothetical protein [Ahrensia kielensis]